MLFLKMQNAGAKVIKISHKWNLDSGFSYNYFIEK